MTDPKHPHWPPEQRSARDVPLPCRLQEALHPEIPEKPARSAP